MRDQRKKTLLGLGGGVVLASAAFAIGTQAGGGAAVAETAGARGEAAETRLVHDRGPGHPGLEALAERLGVEESRLRDALDELRPERGDRRDHAADLARVLKLDVAKVRAALEKARPERGVREARVPACGPGHHHLGVRGPLSDELAEELGVSVETLERAFETLHEEQRAAFARQLAEKLGISVEKIQEALRELPHPGGRGHHRR